MPSLKKPLTKQIVWPLIAGLAIGAGSFFGASEMLQSRQLFAQTPAQTAHPTPEPRSETVAPATDLGRAFRAVHTAVKDAVVNINVVKKSAATPRGRVRIQ